jgi:hypothetical protein
MGGRGYGGGGLILDTILGFCWRDWGIYNNECPPHPPQWRQSFRLSSGIDIRTEHLPKKSKKSYRLTRLVRCPRFHVGRNKCIKQTFLMPLLPILHVTNRYSGLWIRVRMRPVFTTSVPVPPQTLLGRKHVPVFFMYTKSEIKKHLCLPANFKFPISCVD